MASYVDSGMRLAPLSPALAPSRDMRLQVAPAISMLLTAKDTAGARGTRTRRDEGGAAPAGDETPARIRAVRTAIPNAPPAAGRGGGGWRRSDAGGGSWVQAPGGQPASRRPDRRTPIHRRDTPGRRGHHRGTARPRSPIRRGDRPRGNRPGGPGAGRTRGLAARSPPATPKERGPVGGPHDARLSGGLHRGAPPDARAGHGGAIGGGHLTRRRRRARARCSFGTSTPAGTAPPGRRGVWPESPRPTIPPRPARCRRAHLAGISSNRPAIGQRQQGLGPVQLLAAAWPLDHPPEPRSLRLGQLDRHVPTSPGTRPAGRRRLRSRCRGRAAEGRGQGARPPRPGRRRGVASRSYPGQDCGDGPGRRETTAGPARPDARTSLPPRTGRPRSP